ncbi:hypothetical protein DFH08DRAFT_829921 [Mycena albidolilacea]|uniref:Uncharacterized protein n=1 Tax=Mycena albidolilacea TaxID=1033008 RepID=A0AAD7AUM8_9AGAR|nr:hypothetical protein DFH08DRAFT_829921 [Mycena albidolilacea]
MYSWPTNHTQNRTSTLHRKGRANGKEKVNVPDYPVLDNGTLAAATLLEENGRLEWTHINKKTMREPARLKTGKSVVVFPATRPTPLQMPSMSITQRAEQGANFLRTYLPDIDIAGELIREQLSEDAQILRQFQDFDPYVGNQLEAIVQSDSSDQSTSLAFPMGELSRDLNISTLLFSEAKGASLCPSAQAIRTFDTPIQQITASKLKDVGGNQATYLAVRTFGATSLLEMKTPGMRVKEVGSITSSDTGNQQVVDVQVSASPFDMTLVNNQGTVYKYDATTGSNKMRVVRHAPIPSSFDLFWRLELTQSPDTCLLMSKSELKELDFRTEDSALNIYAAVSNEVLTSVEDYQADQTLRLCSTDRVIWIDRRFTAKPLVAFKHSRSFDRSLEAKTIATENGHLTTLSSRKNGLLTIYDISRSQGNLARVQASPYCLTTSANGGIQTGHRFLRHPLEQPDSPMTFFRLSEVGSIHAFQLSATDVGEPSFSWSEDVRRLHIQSANLREEISSLGLQEPTEVDMFPAYEHFFRAHRQRSETDAEEAAESLYDLVEKAPSYWQDLNEPVDCVLTTYDILLRSGDEPADFTRADFLTESVISSTRGYRAVLQGRVSAESLKKDAPWNYDLTNTLSKFDADVSPDIRTIAERLRRFDLKSGEERFASSLRRESEAREQLALDLTLSHHIYSPQPFSMKNDANDELESMTKTLSLEDEAPQMSFGYLRLNPKDDAHDAEKDLIPAGVRLLLKDWDVGTDLREFAYRDPYGEDPEDPAPLRTWKKQEAVPKERPVVDVQRPPPIVASSTSVNPFGAGRRFMSQDPNLQYRPPPIAGSQPVGRNVGLAEMSQDVVMASTQVLPGAYGGRPAVKKKVAKKRLGGF